MSWPRYARSAGASACATGARRVLVHLFAVLLALVGNTPAALTAPPARAAPVARAPAGPVAQLEQLGLVQCKLGDGTSFCRYPLLDLLPSARWGASPTGASTPRRGPGPGAEGAPAAGPRQHHRAPRPQRRRRRRGAQLGARRRPGRAVPAPALRDEGHVPHRRPEARGRLGAGGRPAPGRGGRRQRRARVRQVCRARPGRLRAAAGPQRQQERARRRSSPAPARQLRPGRPHPRATGGYCRYRSPAPYAERVQGLQQPGLRTAPSCRCPPPTPPSSSTSSSSTARPSRTTRCWTPRCTRTRPSGSGPRFGLAVGASPPLAYAPPVGPGSPPGPRPVFPYFAGHLSQRRDRARGGLDVRRHRRLRRRRGGRDRGPDHRHHPDPRPRRPGQAARAAGRPDRRRPHHPARASMLVKRDGRVHPLLPVRRRHPAPPPPACDNSDPIARSGVTISGSSARDLDRPRHRRLVPQPHADPAGLRLRSPVRRHGAGRHRRDRVAHHHLAGPGHRGPGHGAPEPGLVRPAGRTGQDAAQALRLDYTDWDGEAAAPGCWRTRTTATPSSLLLPGYTRAPTSPIDPTTCLSDKKCFLSPAIEYVGGDGQKYSASVQAPGAPPGTPPRRRARPGTPPPPWRAAR